VPAAYPDQHRLKLDARPLDVKPFPRVEAAADCFQRASSAVRSSEAGPNPGWTKSERRVYSRALTGSPAFVAQTAIS
jgi:hypothetical protein